MSHLRRIGREGEDLAAAYLVAKGFTIITRRYTTRHGELDLIALDGDELVFVEVKLRNTAEYVPEEAIGVRKLQSLRRAADAYLLEADEQNRAYRFDVIAIDPTGIRHHKHALT